MPKKEGIKEIASNRKAFHDYFVLERFEAGIELFGTEVKSIRAGQVNLKDSYCTIREGELFVRGMHVSPYEKGNIFNQRPDAHPAAADAQAGDPAGCRRARQRRTAYALVPLSLYFKDSRVKVELGLWQGQKALRQARSADSRAPMREMDGYHGDRCHAKKGMIQMNESYCDHRNGKRRRYQGRALPRDRAEDRSTTSSP